MDIIQYCIDNPPVAIFSVAGVAYCLLGMECFGLLNKNKKNLVTEINPSSQTKINIRGYEYSHKKYQRYFLHGKCS